MVEIPLMFEQELFVCDPAVWLIVAAAVGNVILILTWKLLKSVDCNSWYATGFMKNVPNRILEVTR